MCWPRRARRRKRWATGISSNAGVIYKGLLILGEGAILAGLVLGAIMAFIIDRRFYCAAGFTAAGRRLSFIGLIHAAKVEWNAGGQVALGYLFFGLVCLGFGWANTRHPAAAEKASSADGADRRQDAWSRRIRLIEAAG